ncbi:MAG: tRNA dihydrouridine synthase DusB [Spirochaetaceae bacterium]|nr:tRNA dihydrouridine synthase DusB [Spirochaetaceae bacterium]
MRIGNLLLDGNFFLAPVAGWSDLAFRSICVDFGADFTFTELVSSEALSRGVRTEFLLKRAANEKKYAVQLFGADPAVMYKAAALLEPFCPSMVDINSGCPVPKVTKTGAGSALMRNVPLLSSIVASVKKASHDFLGNVPVSIKIRAGWDNNSINYNECARAAVESGADMISLHARTKTQGYEGKINIDYIADLVTRIAVPVTGSGDLWTAEDALNMLEKTNCAAIMFARGAMGNPFIFRYAKDLLKNKAYNAACAKEKIDTAFRHLDLMCGIFGEKSACLQMRKIFCAYIKGIAGAAAIRNRLVHSQSVADYKDILVGLDV